MSKEIRELIIIAGVFTVIVLFFLLMPWGMS